MSVDGLLGSSGDLDLYLGDWEPACWVLSTAGSETRPTGHLSQPAHPKTPLLVDRKHCLQGLQPTSTSATPLLVGLTLEKQKIIVSTGVHGLNAISPERDEQGCAQGPSPLKAKGMNGEGGRSARWRQDTPCRCRRVLPEFDNNLRQSAVATNSS